MNEEQLAAAYLRGGKLFDELIGPKVDQENVGKNAFELARLAFVNGYTRGSDDAYSLGYEQGREDCISRNDC